MAFRAAISAALVGVVAGGACTDGEQSALADPQNVGTKSNSCGTQCYNIITGGFDHDCFDDCFMKEFGVSKECAECYAATGEYGAKHCKADCLLGWCKEGCLSCTEPAQETLAICTGFTPPAADPCEELEASSAGACSADEQAALQDPQVVGKKANDCGTTAYNIITGKFDHDKFNSCFTASIGIGSACSECYAVTGEYGAQNCKADCLLGWCKEGCLSCTKPAQDTLATCTGFTAAVADPCEELEASSAGACSADEQAALQDPQVVGKKANDCGTTAYNIITGKFDHDKFNSCFTASIGIGSACSECYAVTGEYGAQNCKADCLLGWCKEGCLSCTKPAQDTLATCTGFTAAVADPCEELEASSAGDCSADEQAALQDPQVVGKKANDCGTSAYNIITGKFDHDKFNSCFTASIGIGSACSECYAVTGEYGAQNCKADCLLGWCKEGCLSCTKPAQDTLATCTGFTAAVADPCEAKKFLV